MGKDDNRVFFSVSNLEMNMATMLSHPEKKERKHMLIIHIT